MRRSGAAAIILMLLSGARPALAVEPANEHFERTWARTDRPVAAEIVDRTWMWGPEPFTAALTEPYVDLTFDAEERAVQYFDKARMEISDPSADITDIWYVTNGLLVVELMSGQLQLGDSRFELREPADIAVAGDPLASGAPATNSPTYAAMAALTALPPSEAPVLIERIDGDAAITVDTGMAVWNVTPAYYVIETNHAVASVFWSFMNAFGTVYLDGAFVDELLFQDPFFATGFPIAEAYWTNVSVDGVARDVLVQCFERRCLTYTPENPEGWEIESGNVGMHYFLWRYGTPPGEFIE
jgi:hypothetical protein